MFKKIENPDACEMRSVIRFLNAKNMKPAEFHHQLCDVYGEHALNSSMVEMGAPVQWSADNADVPSLSFWAQALENLMRAKKKVAQRYANRKPQYLAGDTVVYRLSLVSSNALNVSAKLSF